MIMDQQNPYSLILMGDFVLEGILNILPSLSLFTLAKLVNSDKQKSQAPIDVQVVQVLWMTSFLAVT